MRDNKKRSLKPQFAFVVDGECEFWYIQMLKRNEHDLGINLKPEIPQKKTIDAQYKMVRELSVDYDKVFWIIDFDIIVKETREVKDNKKTRLQELEECCRCLDSNYEYENVVVIINNPCFEYWLLLHFVKTAKYYRSYEEVAKELKKHLPQYKKTRKFYTKQNKDIYLQLKSYLSQAIKNADKLGLFDFRNTNVGMTQMQKIFNAEFETGKKIKEVISLK